jgi:hypothetical protein
LLLAVSSQLSAKKIPFARKQSLRYTLGIFEKIKMRISGPPKSSAELET